MSCIDDFTFIEAIHQMTSQMPLVLVMNLSAVAFTNKADGGPPGSSAGSTETQRQGCKSVD